MSSSTDAEGSFCSHLIELASGAVTEIGRTDPLSTYAISFFVYDDDDDPRFPTLTIGHNTEEKVTSVLDPPEGSQRSLPSGAPQNEAEGRWNFAFWLQDQAVVIGDLERDPVGAELRKRWFESLGLWYEWPEGPTGSPDWDRAIRKGEEITHRFVGLCVEIGQLLHSNGLIGRTFSRPIPVIVHELEYYEEIAGQTERANPAGLASEFCAWVRSS